MSIVALPGVSRPELPIDQQPCREVVNMLERLLEDARAGKIVGIAVALATVEGHARSAWKPDSPGERYTVSLTAAIALLHHRIMSAAMEGSSNPPEPPEPA